MLHDDELHSLTWLWRAADQMMIAAKAIYPLLDVAEHREAGSYYSIIHEYPMILADKTRHPWQPRLEQVDPPRAPPADCRQQKLGKCGRSRTIVFNRNL